MINSRAIVGANGLVTNGSHPSFKAITSIETWALSMAVQEMNIFFV